MTIYIAAGAIVYADILGRKLENVTITGRGIVQGKIRITDCSNFNVDGIFIRNTKGWSNTLTTVITPVTETSRCSAMKPSIRLTA